MRFDLGFRNDGVDITFVALGKTYFDADHAEPKAVLIACYLS